MAPNFFIGGIAPPPFPPPLSTYYCVHVRNQLPQEWSCNVLYSLMMGGFPFFSGVGACRAGLDSWVSDYTAPTPASTTVEGKPPTYIIRRWPFEKSSKLAPTTMRSIMHTVQKFLICFTLRLNLEKVNDKTLTKRKKEKSRGLKNYISYYSVGRNKHVWCLSSKHQFSTMCI